MTVVTLDQQRVVNATDNGPSTSVTINSLGLQGPQGLPTTVNGKSGASITLVASDVGAIATTARGAANGVASLDASSLVPIAQLPLSGLATNFVDLSTNQSVGGTKTFTTIPVGPASDPTTGNQLARKAYVDTFLPLAGGTLSGSLATAGITGTTSVMSTSVQTPILLGSTSSGGTLTLKSTTNATKGKILLGNAGTSAYDEVNDRIGVGTASPSVKIHGQQASTATNVTLRLDVAGDTNARWSSDANGLFQWGPGNAAVDTNLYRAGVGQLKTDGTLTASVFGPGTGVTAWVNVKGALYGAKGDGVTDDTAAIAAAALAVHNAGGGTVYFPAGTYMSNTITFNNGTTGYFGVNFEGDGTNCSTIKKIGNGDLLVMSGPATDTTGATHCRQCSIHNMRLHGNSKTGTLLKLYYADNLFFMNLYMTNNLDICVDTTECWDSRFYNPICVTNGSATANAATPNFYLRNSATASGFGHSADSVNQVHIVNARFEDFTTGAIWIQQGVSNTSSPNGFFFVNIKMEAHSINGGPHLLVDNHCTGAYVENVYVYSGGFAPGYSTAQDAITWGGSANTLKNVGIATGATQTVANGVTINSNANQNCYVENVYGNYNGVPTGQHIAFGATTSGGFMVINCPATVTSLSQLNALQNIIATASNNNVINVLVSGDTNKRLQIAASGTMFLGPGNAATDVTLARVTTGVWGVTQGSLLIGTSDPADGGSGVLKMGNAAVFPGTPNAGSGVMAVRGGGPWWKDAGGGSSASMVSPSEFSASPANALSESVPRFAWNSTACAIGATTGTVYMIATWLPAGSPINTLGFVTGATAAGTPTHWWLGLADQNGLQLAHTADQTTTAIAANSKITKSLTATYTTTRTGLYYFLISVTATTNPTLSGVGTVTNADKVTPLLAGVSTSAAQTTPGTDGTTSYVIPTTQGAIGYIYCTT